MHQKYTMVFTSDTNLAFIVALKIEVFSISFSTLELVLLQVTNCNVHIVRNISSDYLHRSFISRFKIHHRDQKTLWGSIYVAYMLHMLHICWLFRKTFFMTVFKQFQTCSIELVKLTFWSFCMERQFCQKLRFIFVMNGLDFMTNGRDFITNGRDCVGRVLN